MTRQHIAYLTALYDRVAHERTIDGQATMEYVAGETTLIAMLNEDERGLGRLEQFLIEQGLIDRTTRGRKLTDRGIAKARNLAQVPRP